MPRAYQVVIALAAVVAVAGVVLLVGAAIEVREKPGYDSPYERNGSDGRGGGFD